MKYLKAILLFVPTLLWKLMKFCANRTKAFYGEHGLRGVFSRKNKVLIMATVLGVGGTIFYGGMKYQSRNNVPSKSEVLGTRTEGEAPVIPLKTSHERIEGSVVKIDEKSIKLKGTDGKSESYDLDPEVEVMSSGDFIKLGDIKTGDNVRIYIKTGSEQSQLVDKINIAD